MSNSLKERYETTPLYGSNAAAIERLYEQFLDDPDKVPSGWREYFRELGRDADETPHGPIREQLREQARRGRRNGAAAMRPGTLAVDASEKQAAVSRLIQVYSLRGHQIADIDPLGLMQRHMPGVLKLDYLGLTDAFAALHEPVHQYTYWDYQRGAWQKDNGLRIDHLLLSPQAADRLNDSGIDRTPRGKEKASDHTPVWCRLDG